jgi:flagellar protein FliL
MATTTPAAPVKEAGKDDKNAAKDNKDGTGGKEKKPRNKKKLIVIALVVALVGFGGYTKFLKKPGPPGPPEPGVVLALDPITLNLADGHFLKLTLALQFTAAASAGGGHGGGAEPDGSQALDIAIDQLSNKRIAELNSSAARNKAKEKLLHAIEEAYHHEVMDIYFKEFVMQ